MEYRTIRNVLLASALAASSGCSALGYRLVDHGPDSGKSFERINDKPKSPAIDPEKAKQYLQELGNLRARKFQMPPEKYVEGFRELQRKYGPVSDVVRPVRPVQSPAQPEAPVTPIQSSVQSPPRSYGEDLSHYVSEPVKRPEKDSWWDLPNWILKGFDITFGQARRLWSDDRSRISEAYRRKVSKPIRAGVAAAALSGAFYEADRLAVDRNWQSPRNSLFGHKDDGPRRAPPAPPSPTSKPPLGLFGPEPNPNPSPNPNPQQPDQFGGGSAE